MVKLEKEKGIVNTTVRTLIAGLVFTLLSLPLFAAEGVSIYMRYTEGSVQLLPSGSQSWLPATVNTSLAEGDTLRITNPGNAELLMRDGSLMRMTRGSRIKVLSVERSAIQFYVEAGRAHVNFRGLKGYPLFLSTSSAQIDAIERAVFRVDVNAKGDTEISVLAGELFVAQPKGKMKIIAGNRLVMKKDGNSPLYTKTRPADEWERWNAARDREAQPSPGQGQGPAAGDLAVSPSGPAVSGQQPATGGYVIVESVPVYNTYYYPWYYRSYPCGGWYGPCYRGYIGPGYWYSGYRHRGPYRGWPGPGRGYRGRPHRR